MMTQIRTGELKAVGRRSSIEYVILADTSPEGIPSEDDVCTISMCADVACIPLIAMFADMSAYHQHHIPCRALSLHVD